MKHYYIHCLVYFGTTTTTTFVVVVVAPPHQHWTPTGGIYCPDFWIISYIVRKKKKEVGALMKRPLPTSKSRDLLFDITRTPAESPCQKWFLFSLQRARRNECFPCVNEWETFSLNFIFILDNIRLLLLSWCALEYDVKTLLFFLFFFRLFLLKGLYIEGQFGYNIRSIIAACWRVKKAESARLYNSVEKERERKEQYR